MRDSIFCEKDLAAAYRMGRGLNVLLLPILTLIGSVVFHWHTVKLCSVSFIIMDF